MIIWQVEPWKVQALCGLVGLISATLGYYFGSHSQAEISATLEHITGAKP